MGKFIVVALIVLMIPVAFKIIRIISGFVFKLAFFIIVIAAIGLLLSHLFG